MEKSKIDTCEKGVILASPPHVVHQDFLYPPTYTKVAGCGFLSITQAGQFFLKYKLFSTGKHVKENRSELGKQNTPSDMQTQLHKNHKERTTESGPAERRGEVIHITRDPQK